MKTGTTIFPIKKASRGQFQALRNVQPAKPRVQWANVRSNSVPTRSYVRVQSPAQAANVRRNPWEGGPPPPTVRRPVTDKWPEGELDPGTLSSLGV
ncbi:unnamed protein product [Parnassius apollo]|uniref:(apollo) hypothetical protein n=1 Tax=Parnassius apollo TaxID=110799 RepID=A0A8S3Y183_PARAO|nr:unnamed protein product [Parnassius apollo]